MSFRSAEMMSQGAWIDSDLRFERSAQHIWAINATLLPEIETLNFRIVGNPETTGNLKGLAYMLSQQCPRVRVPSCRHSKRDQLVPADACSKL